MEIIQTNLRPKVLKNQLFIKAVDYLIDEGKVGSQKELAQVTGITEATFSNIRNDKKIVSDKTIRKLLDAFPAIFNHDYFRGKSIYMLMSDYIEAKADADEQKQKSDNSACIEEMHTNIPDMSSVFNAAIAAKDEAIESLKRELCAKDDLIQSLREQLAAKDNLIAEQKARLIDYRHQIDQFQHSNISNYPFPIGAADGENIHRKSQKS